MEGQIMKKLTRAFLVFLICFCLCIKVQAAEMLIPGGQLVGLELFDGNVYVAAFDENPESPAKEAGLQPGDKIISINSQAVASAADIKNILNRADTDVTLQLSRGSSTFEVKLTPQITENGPRLGIYLKQGTTGVGTVTYYNPQDSSFAALGHGVNTKHGNLLPMHTGKVYDVSVISVRKGKPGEPGQLMGSLQSCTQLGALTKNTPYGVFGTLGGVNKSAAIEVADPEDVKTGPATIRSTVSGSLTREYQVEIVKVYGSSKSAGRNMLIKVTDPDLLAATGGIVQGMSGSPIIQDGKLVGAVTHVLVNDPTTGYGIFIENMLDAAA
jgi:stage IV sporulation protein B